MWLKLKSAVAVFYDKQSNFFITRFLYFFLIIILPLLSAGISQEAKLFFYSLSLLIVVSFFSETVNKPKINFKIFFLWLLFIFFYLLSTINSVSISRSIIGLFDTMLIFVLVALASIVFNTKKGKVLLIYFILFTGFLLSILSLRYYIPGVQPPVDKINFLYANFGHNNLSDYLLLCFPLGYFLLIKTELVNKKKKIILFFLLAFFFINLILTFSRASWLILLFFLVVQFLGEKNNKSVNKLEKKLIFIPLLLLLCSVIIIFLVNIFFTLKNEKIADTSFWGRQILKSFQWEKRPEYIRQSLIIFKNNPIFGMGFNNFFYGSLKYQSEPRSFSAYSHNFLLQMISEGGLFCFIAFIMLLSYLFYKSYQNSRNNDDFFSKGIFWAVLLSFVHSFFDYDWNLLAIFFTCLLLLSVSANAKVRKNLFSSEIFFPIIIISGITLIFLFSNLIGLAYFYKGNFYEGKNKNILAGEYYKKAFMIYPFNQQIVKKNFEFLIKNQDTTINRQFKIFYVLDGSNAEFFNWIASQYLSIGDINKAKYFLKKALENDPKNINYWYKLISHEKNPGCKINLFNSFVKNMSGVNNLDLTHRDLGKIYVDMASIYFDKNDEKKSIEFLEKAISTDPWTLDYYLKLKFLYSSANSTENLEKLSVDCFNHFPLDKRCGN